MNTIRNKILIPVILLISISLVIVGGISSLLNYRSTLSSLEQSMSETAVITASRIQYNLEAIKNVAVETGCITRLANAGISAKQKQQDIDQRVKSYGFEGGGVLSNTGRDAVLGIELGNMEFFEETITGEPHISEPLLWEPTGKMTIIIAAPIWKNGIPNSSTVGVVYFLTSPTFLNDIVTSINISDNGAAYLLDAEGTTIAHKEVTRVESKENIFKLAEQNVGLKPLADIHREMTASNRGFDTYEFAGISKLIAYAPIADTHNWSVAVNAPINDFMGETFFGIFVIVVMLIVFIGIGAWVGVSIASSISKPVNQIALAAKKLSMGDFEVEINHSSKDELGELAVSTQQLCSTIVGVINDMDHVLKAMSLGDFTVNSERESLYVGHFNALLESVNGIKRNLSSTLSSINAASDQVSSGSEQVASGAQALSDGTTEQAGAVEQLSSTIAEISKHVTMNAKNAQLAREQSELASKEVVDSNKQMQEMIVAMNAISGKSNEISKIIKTIEDIAFQTNILALNAAVEAARAGSAGKGFAVVADEVRNLAGKSAQAAKNTTILIEETVSAVNNGTGIAGVTAKAMERVVTGSSEVSGLIVEISDASQEQASSINKVRQGLEQISGVVQTNSATAEESAASSEELSSQSQILKSLVSKFKL